MNTDIHKFLVAQKTNRFGGHNTEYEIWFCKAEEEIWLIKLVVRTASLQKYLGTSYELAMCERFKQMTFFTFSDTIFVEEYMRMSIDE